MRDFKFFAMLLFACATSMSAQNAAHAPAEYDTELVSVPEGLEIQRFHSVGEVCFGESFIGGSYRSSDYFVELAFDEDDVYMKGFFDSAPEAWLKGKRSNDILSFPSRQYLGLATLRDGTQEEAWLSHIQNNETMKLKYKESTGKITLAPSGYPYLVIGPTHQRYETPFSFTMTKYEIAEGFDFLPIRVPEGHEVFDAEIKLWRTFLEYTLHKKSTQMCVVGDTLYVKGLCPDFPEQWLICTASPDNPRKMVINPNQYLGLFRRTNYSTTYTWLSLAKKESYYLYSTNEELSFDWNPETKTLSYNWNNLTDEWFDDNPIVYIENASTTEMSYIEAIIAMKVSANITGLVGIEIPDEPDAIYSLDGRKHKEVMPGLNIIHKNGKTSKILQR